MYRSPAIAKILKWASENKTGTTEIRSVADSPTWEQIDNSIDIEFSTEGRHLRMGLSLDGVNPFPMQHSTHSMWRVMVLFYNLPPWLVTKNFFVSLSLLLSRKESPTSKNIDVYLSPLVEELEQFWEGVPVFDASADAAVEVPCFNMRGILMWTISDFPAYGLISGLCTKGYLAYPVCGLHTDSHSAKGPKKLKEVYLGARRWTRRNHLYRYNFHFNGCEEHKICPLRQSVDDILRAAELRNTYLRGGRLDVLGEQMDRMIHTIDLELKGGAFFSTYLTGKYGIRVHSRSVCVYIQEVHQVCEIISEFLLCLVCSSTVHCSILSEISIILGTLIHFCVHLPLPQ
jgi:hypothetical protein